MDATTTATTSAAAATESVAAGGRLKGAATKLFETYACEICGKRRTQGNKNAHFKCSKIKQAKYVQLRAAEAAASQNE
jgi:hypothetical protein